MDKKRKISDVFSQAIDAWYDAASEIMNFSTQHQKNIAIQKVLRGLIDLSHEFNNRLIEIEAIKERLEAIENAAIECQERAEYQHEGRNAATSP